MQKIVFIVFVTIGVSCTTYCPKQCDCDIDNGLNRALCDDQNIVSIDVGVSKAVQIYSLRRNLISELQNFCFKEIGYQSLRILDLSHNVIFWIGMHAFSGLDQLYHLDLSGNRLRDIPAEVFWDTPGLDILDLSGNIFESLKNEPFITHNRLQVLNLNSCRIKFLPPRLFNRLPNLKKLDLSENYFVTFNIDIIRPLMKLERIELRNDYLHCSPDIIAAETYIASQRIAYNKLCTKKLPKISEKMISMVTEREPVNIDGIWNETSEKNRTEPVLQQNKTLTPFEKFDKDFSAFQAFVIGLEVGLAVGVVGTYVWLRRFCSCGQLNCIAPRRRRPRNRNDEVRTNLLRNHFVNVDLETPPIFRREMPDRRAPGPPTAPVYETISPRPTRDPPSMADVIRRPETPPPPYHECRLNI
ncbi:leucine-rich repeat-containing G-protein coupled receptor 6 [Aricia agestis]|uniref:leucine-rich repeat-containing G-protein coupled receptor 6 n=1 Tax=Aricia agestis TaxID=91739 RepID=UPI001C209E04|nr:leucine-rich repeat-containing G-protein coupled receptor 6 [Aricia agestis]